MRNFHLSFATGLKHRQISEESAQFRIISGRVYAPVSSFAFSQYIYFPVLMLLIAIHHFMIHSIFFRSPKSNIPTPIKTSQLSRVSNHICSALATTEVFISQVLPMVFVCRRIWEVFGKTTSLAYWIPRSTAPAILSWSNNSWGLPRFPIKHTWIGSITVSALT